MAIPSFSCNTDGYDEEMALLKANIKYIDLKICFDVLGGVGDVM